METAKQSTVRHWLVVVTGCMLMMMSAGCVFSAAGIYYTSIAEDFGVMRSQIVVWLTIAFLAATVTLPIVGSLLAKRDARVITTVGVICMAIGEFIFAGAQSLWWLYVGAVPIGIGLGSVGFVTVPTIINRWFKKRVGLALGIAMACSGIGGVIFNYVGSAVMTASNWHMGFLVNGICVLVLCLPFTTLVLRSRPSDLGLKMYGEDEAEQEKVEAPALYGMTAARAKKTLAFYLCILFIVCAVFGTNCYQFFPSYAQALPATAGNLTFAATLASSAMIGQLVGKIALGMIADKSMKLAASISMACGIIGVLMMMLLTGSIFALLAGAFIFGWFYASINIISPMMCRTAFGTVEYSVIFGRISALNTFASAISMTVLGLVMDFFGFNSLFVVVIVVCLVLACIALYVLSKPVKPEDGIIDVA